MVHEILRGMALIAIVAAFVLAAFALIGAGLYLLLRGIVKSDEQQ
jgi:hypothetical protein